jgi:hypothetical protein
MGFRLVGATIARSGSRPGYSRGVDVVKVCTISPAPRVLRAGATVSLWWPLVWANEGEIRVSARVLEGLVGKCGTHYQSCSLGATSLDSALGLGLEELVGECGTHYQSCSSGLELGPRSCCSGFSRV